jgi:lysophospholipase L1-like esterase
MPWRWWKDGVYQAEVSIAGSAGWITLLSGLDSGSEHEYRIECVGPAAFTLTYFMLRGGSMNATPLTRLDAISGIGDSITQVSIVSPADGFPNPYASHISTIGNAHGLEVINSGLSGSTVQFTGQTDEFLSGALRRVPKFVVILYGVNDLLGGATVADFKTAYKAMLAKIEAGTSLFPALTAPSKVWCLGLLIRRDEFTAGALLYNAAIAEAVSETTIPEGGAPIYYVDANASGWPDPDIAGDFVDSTHLATNGYSKVAAKLESLLFAGISTVEEEVTHTVSIEEVRNGAGSLLLTHVSFEEGDTGAVSGGSLAVEVVTALHAISTEEVRDFDGNLLLTHESTEEAGDASMSDLDAPSTAGSHVVNIRALDEHGDPGDTGTSDSFELTSP